MGWYRLIWIVGQPTRFEGPFLSKSAALASLNKNQLAWVKWFWKKPEV